MGMFLSKYSMLNALGYGADRPILEETKKILDRFKLFGLILHDPQSHPDFHATLRNSFERLDFLTGRDFYSLLLQTRPEVGLREVKEGTTLVFGRQKNYCLQ
jgi:hypothetical protein